MKQPLWHVPHFRMGLFWAWSFFAHFCNTCHLFFLFKAFFFHFTWSFVNSYKYILTFFICMFDEIIKKLTLILHSNQKTVFTPKNKKFKLRRKAIPSWRYSINTMNWIILVQAIGGVLLVPGIIQCTCNTPFKVY